MQRPQTFALLGLSLTLLLAQLGISVANVALPTLGTVFSASTAAVIGVVWVYVLAITAASVVAGLLGNVWGRLATLRVGVVLFLAGSLAAALAPSLAWLLGSRVVQGLGSGTMLVVALALVGDVVPPDRKSVV